MSPVVSPRPARPAHPSPPLSRAAGGGSPRPHAPVFSEIERLLEAGHSSSSSRSESVSPSQVALETLPRDDDDDDDDEHDTSEMILNNLYCVSCGTELTSAGKKFATCNDCGTVPQDRVSRAKWTSNALEDGQKEGEANAAANVMPFRFVRGDTLNAEDMLRLQRSANSRKETLLGLSTSLQSWSDDMTRSFPTK